MKTVYVITYYGDKTSLCFTNEEDAEKYCEIENDNRDLYDGKPYSYRTQEQYNSFEEYKANNKGHYKKLYKSILKNLDESISRIKENKHYFSVEFEREIQYRFTMKEFEEAVNNFKEKRYYARQPEYCETLTHEAETRYLTKEDLPIIKKGYEKAKRLLQSLENKRVQYAKELEEMNKKENNSEEESIAK